MLSQLIVTGHVLVLGDHLCACPHWTTSCSLHHLLSCSLVAFHVLIVLLAGSQLISVYFHYPDCLVFKKKKKQ